MPYDPGDGNWGGANGAGTSGEDLGFDESHEGPVRKPSEGCLTFILVPIVFWALIAGAIYLAVHYLLR